MSTHIAEAIGELEKVTADVRSTFADLSVGQLNWKPDVTRWSVAQCLDHLIVTNQFYFPIFESVRQGRKPTFWERHSPLSGFFGRFLIKALSPDYKRKAKTSSKSQPSLGEIDPGIIDRFAQHQCRLIQEFQALAGSDVDLSDSIITSPLGSLVTYSIDHAVSILVVHEQRHVLQAKRVTASPGFPRA